MLRSRNSTGTAGIWAAPVLDLATIAADYKTIRPVVRVLASLGVAIVFPVPVLLDGTAIRFEFHGPTSWGLGPL